MMKHSAKMLKLRVKKREANRCFGCQTMYTGFVEKFAFGKQMSGILAGKVFEKRLSM